jgi:hypothetical protein
MATLLPARAYGARLAASGAASLAPRLDSVGKDTHSTITVVAAPLPGGELRMLGISAFHQY